jgi:nickel/cobalt exporter
VDHQYELMASSALLLGFVHGLGADHLMAIGALSIGLPGTVRRTRALKVAVSFAAGHAVLLAVGAALVIVAGWSLPERLDRVGETLGGVILIALGAAGLWMAVRRKLYGHKHSHGHSATSHSHDHLHWGSPDQHPVPHRHAHVPTVLGALFAISGLRALTLLMPLGGAASGGSLLVLLGLVCLFAFGILLSMTLFGFVVAGVLGAPRVAAWVGNAAAVITAVASLGLGCYWVLSQLI